MSKVIRGEYIYEGWNCLGEEPLTEFYCSPEVVVPDDWEYPVDVEDALDWEDDRG